MTRTRKLCSFAGMALVAAAVTWYAFGVRRAQADYTKSQSLVSTEKDWEKLHYEPASACADCHTNPKQGQVTAGNLNVVMLTEYAIWQTYDKHAQAYAVLKGPRGARIAEILKQNVLEAKTGCLNCHGMNNLIEENKKHGAKVNLNLEDGVSCGGCHGPSTAANPNDAWKGAHSQLNWRDNDAHAKYKLGLRDLRDPVIRAELCASCHIGNASEGKVVTHAMMAAGHPPLPPIEMVTFAKNEPQHWRSAASVPLFEQKKGDEKTIKNYHLKDLPFNRTQFALLGNIVSIRETLRLAGDRADFTAAKPAKDVLWPELVLNPAYGADPKERWPEIAMAHTDCFACHHDLKYPGYRQDRGFGYAVPGLALDRVVPGRPVIRTWPLAGFAAAAVQTDKKLNDLQPKLAALAKATSARPFGDAALVKTSAADLIAHCDGVIADLRSSNFTRDKAVALAKAICTLWDKKDSFGNEPSPDYETARQMASLLSVVCDDLKLDKAAQDKLADLRKQLGTEPFTKRDERVAVVLELVKTVIVAKNPGVAVPPLDDGIKKFQVYLKDVTNEEELKKQVGLGNQFLVALSQGLDSKAFTEEFLKKEVVDKLQKLSDAEEKDLLEKLAGYDQKTFKASLKALLPLIK
jgi:Cytochrome c554 and c-prime